MTARNQNPVTVRSGRESFVRCAMTCFLMVATLVLARASAEEWPTFRHDAARSGISPTQLAWPLSECWVFQSPYPPQPAWGDPKPVPIEDILELRRVHFDDVFQVVAAEGAVYFGSSADNKVYCLGLETGDVRWTKITGGPIRLAPTVAGDRVYVASDDGYAYCLAAGDGTQVWKFHAAPEERRMLGHGKMISPWPSRTSVLVDQGTAYFGAGIFPAEGVFLYAVNADSGQLVWRNDATGENPQSRVSPQGYLLASDTMLYAPMGRVSPAALRRTNGELVYETSFGKQVGGSYALLAGDQLYTGTEELVGFNQQTRDRFAAFPGRRMVVGEKAYFLATGTHLVAMDRQTRAELWKTACPCADELIQAGNSLVAGGAGRVLAVDAASGEVRWDVAVEGAAKGLAVVDGRLLVSTDKGRIYCFASQGPPRRGVVSAPVIADPFADSPLSPLFKQAAETILEQTKVRRGYCLVLGCETGQLALELARRSDLMIYAVSPDAEKVAAARQAIDAAGLYGARICVEQWPLENVPYADYFANLIVSETPIVTGQLPGDPHEAFRLLKPLGGTLLVGQPADRPPQVKPLDDAASEAWRTALAAADARLTRDRGIWLTGVRGALPGSGSWTHQYGNPGNTACSDDQRVKCPLGLLWFGSPGPGKMQNRHERAAAPLSQDGRMFVQGENALMAYDIYNGLLLWQRDIAGASRPNASHDGGNLAVSSQGLFVGVGEKCLRLDPATGETRAEFAMPAGPGGFQRWGCVAAIDKRLYGSRSGAKAGDSDAVLAFDTESGQQTWTYESHTIAHNAIAIGGDTLFLVTSAITDEQRRATAGRGASDDCETAGGETRPGGECAGESRPAQDRGPGPRDRASAVGEAPQPDRLRPRRLGHVPQRRAGAVWRVLGRALLEGVFCRPVRVAADHRPLGR